MCQTFISCAGISAISYRLQGIKTQPYFSEGGRSFTGYRIGLSKQIHYSPYQRQNTNRSLQVAAHFKQPYHDESLRCTFILLIFVNRREKEENQLHDVEARSKTACINNQGLMDQKDKSKKIIVFSKIHYIFVCIYISTSYAIDHVKQNTPVQLLSSR